MKALCTIWMALCLLVACKQPDKLMEVSISLTSNPENQLVNLVSMDYASSALQLDTSLLPAGTATGNLTTLLSDPGIYYLLFGKDGKRILFVNDEERISISADWNKLSAYTISSPGSNALKKLLATTNGFLTASDSLKKLAATKDIPDSIRNVYTTQQENSGRELKLFLKQFADTTAQAPVALYAVGLLTQQQADSSLLKPVTQKLLGRFPGNESVQKFSSAYFNQLAKEARVIVPGKKAPVFTLPDTSGQPVTLSAYIGKYTLVDFWASWCPNCRKENPQVVSAYKAYKDKNFAVLGVSLDKEKTAWTQAIQKDSLHWQHVSDLKEWKSPVVNIYGIEALPFNVLLDTTGKIVAVNLTGTELKNTLATLLK